MDKTGLVRMVLCIWLVWCSGYLRSQEDTLSLIFAGDIMNNQAMIDAACIQKDKIYDYSHCFEYISPVLEGAHLAIGNLELTLPGKPPYTGFPHFRSPEVYAKALKRAGFDLLVTANNHSNDSGPLGVSKTIDILKRQGFMQTGTFKSEAERKATYPFIIYKNGFKIALLNYTHHTNGIPTKAPVIVNSLKASVQMRKDLAAARAQKPDFMIVFLHWGEELNTTENSTQRQLAKELIAEGVDLIIGAHPHVVQPMRYEEVKLKDGSKRSALVAYSLGNFISNMYQLEASGSILLRVQLAKKRKQTGARLIKHDYAPIWRWIKTLPDGRSKYYVLPIMQVDRDPKMVAGLPEKERKKMVAYANGLKGRLTVRKG